MDLALRISPLVSCPTSRSSVPQSTLLASAYIYQRGAWSSARKIAGATSILNSVSCPTAGVFCMAVAGSTSAGRGIHVPVFARQVVERPTVHEGRIWRVVGLLSGRVPLRRGRLGRRPPLFERGVVKSGLLRRPCDVLDLYVGCLLRRSTARSRQWRNRNHLCAWEMVDQEWWSDFRAVAVSCASTSFCVALGRNNGPPTQMARGRALHASDWASHCPQCRVPRVHSAWRLGAPGQQVERSGAMALRTRTASGRPRKSLAARSLPCPAPPRSAALPWAPRTRPHLLGWSLELAAIAEGVAMRHSRRWITTASHFDSPSASVVEVRIVAIHRFGR